VILVKETRALPASDSCELYDPAMICCALGIASVHPGPLRPYVQLLGRRAWTSVRRVDDYIKDRPVSPEDADPDAEIGKSYGKNRVVNQIMQRLIDDKGWEKLRLTTCWKRLEDNGFS